MDYNEALSYIFSLPKLANKLGNDTLHLVLDSLGSPQKSLKFVHIVGTNGKGSAAAMISSVLESAGYKTGLYTSPFILTFNERIRLGRENIKNDDLAKYTEIVKNAVDILGVQLSQFAFITATAMLYYFEMDTDIVVLEAGLGGRLDATNVIEESLLSVIMSISLDHTELLGNSTAEIAREKCGVIKRAGKVVAYRNSDEINNIVKNCAEDKGAELYFADKAEYLDSASVIGGKRYELSLSGSFQAQNAAVAVKAAEILAEIGYNISEQDIISGLKNTTHPCRFERIKDNVIIDGAHNTDAVNALCNAIKGINVHKTAIIAMMQDKDAESAIRALKGIFDRAVITELDMPRCMNKESLAHLFKDIGINAEKADTLHDAFRIAEESELAVIFGSIYLAGEAKRYFGQGICKKQRRPYKAKILYSLIEL